MELSVLLLRKILSMALMMLMGFAVVKIGAVKKGQTGVLSSLTLYIICPCMILSAFQLEWSSERAAGLLLAALAAVFLHVLYIALTAVLKKCAKLDRIEQASLIYSNGGNLIVPLVGATIGEKYVFYCCAFLAVQTILIWTHLPRLLVPENAKKGGLKKILLNPNMISIAVGFLFFVCRITFPPIIGDTIDSVGGMIGPAAMLMIGMLMAEVDMKGVCRSWKSWLVVGGRLVLYPLLLTLCFALSGVTRMFPWAKGVLLVTTLAACAPIAVSVTQMADISGLDSKKASALNVLSVILCIVTMPAMIAVYQLIC